MYSLGVLSLLFAIVNFRVRLVSVDDSPLSTLIVDILNILWTNNTNLGVTQFIC